MAQLSEKDWNPGTYNRFRGLRLQPGLDLLNAVGQVPDGDVVDLGCGNGSLAPDLRNATQGILQGVDASPAMLAKADDTGCYDVLTEADIALWNPDRRLAMIYSNAALQWLSDHETLFSRLVDCLAPGGILAVQMPNQTEAASHHTWRRALDEITGGAQSIQSSEVLTPNAYFDLLQSRGHLRIWETEYLQPLPRSEQGHPVRLFTESTYARPFLEAAGDAANDLISTYENLVNTSYPLRSDGSVLFPFRRLFLILTRDG